MLGGGIRGNNYLKFRGAGGSFPLDNFRSDMAFHEP